MDAQTRYGHAAELAQSQPLVDKLAFLVSELKKWADLNPGLKPLHAEFAGVLRQMKEARTDA